MGELTLQKHLINAFCEIRATNLSVSGLSVRIQIRSLIWEMGEETDAPWILSPDTNGRIVWILPLVYPNNFAPSVPRTGELRVC